MIFNSLTVEMRTLFKFLMPMAKPIGGWLGMSLLGAPSTSRKDLVVKR